MGGVPDILSIKLRNVVLIVSALSLWEIFSLASNIIFTQESYGVEVELTWKVIEIIASFLNAINLVVIIVAAICFLFEKKKFLNW